MEHRTTEKEQNAEVFAEIKEAEKKAGQIIGDAAKEKERIINEAKLKSSSLMSIKFDEIEQEKNKRISNFESKVYVLKDTKIDEAKEKFHKITKEAQKNVDYAADFVFNKFLESIKADD